MTPEMITYIWVAIIGLFATVIAAIIAGYYAVKGIEKRSGSQNFRDDMETARIALEISEKSTAKQLELEIEVASLKKILKNNHYKITTVTIFSLAEQPKIEKVTSTIEVMEAKVNF